MKKEEVKKRQELINEAYDLSENIDISEMDLSSILSEIKKLKPTKKELDNGLQDLFDMYS